jgi:hypothetical protein
MKAICLAFVMVTFILWIDATSYANSSNPTSQQVSSGNEGSHGSHYVESTDAANAGSHRDLGKPSQQLQNGGRISDVTHLRSRTNVTKINRPKQPASNRGLPPRGNANDLRRPEPNRASTAARTGLIVNPRPNDRTLPAQPPTLMRLGPSNGNVRHRGFNPPVISGLANSGTANNGTISGTHMSRRP